jgi:hypothetical protein
MSKIRLTEDLNISFELLSWELLYCILVFIGLEVFRQKKSNIELTP